MIWQLNAHKGSIRFANPAQKLIDSKVAFLLEPAALAVSVVSVSVSNDAFYILIMNVIIYSNLYLLIYIVLIY